MRGYKTEGIILKRLNFGETDRLLTIFTKHYGKIKAIAKGVRRLKSRKAGSLELFNQLQLVIAEGKNLDIITEVELSRSFNQLRKNLKLVIQAFQVVEALDKLTPERQPSRQLFQLLQEGLQRLDQGQESAVLEFEIALLKELGFGLPKKLDSKSVKSYIETISEKKLMSKGIFPDPRSD